MPPVFFDLLSTKHAHSLRMRERCACARVCVARSLSFLFSALKMFRCFCSCFSPLGFRFALDKLANSLCVRVCVRGNSPDRGNCPSQSTRAARYCAAATRGLCFELLYIFHKEKRKKRKEGTVSKISNSSLSFFFLLHSTHTHIHTHTWCFSSIFFFCKLFLFIRSSSLFHVFKPSLYQ